MDQGVLWGKLTDELVDKAFQFYKTFYYAPPAIKVRAIPRIIGQDRSGNLILGVLHFLSVQALLHGTMGTGLFAILFKLFVWDDSAMFFDGSSLGNVHSHITTTPSTVCPNGRPSKNIAAYLFGMVVYLSVIIPALETVANPVKDVDTREVQVEALRILSAGNVIIIGTMLLVLSLQVRFLHL